MLDAAAPCPDMRYLNVDPDDDWPTTADSYQWLFGPGKSTP